MSIDAIGADACFDYAGWALETGLWNGREVTWQGAADFKVLSSHQTFEFPLDSITTSTKSAVADFFETIGRGLIDPYLLNPETEQLKFPAPQYYESGGKKCPDQMIMGINGINTSFEDMKNHAQYLKQLVPDQSVGWVCNRSHGVLFDLAEVFNLNYIGNSPNTSKDLREKWTAFHEANRSDPDAKILQFCHSQGAIHTRNALASAPKEIQNRVIVVAIAPAVVVPRDACFQAFNYASKKDIVHYGELIFAGFWDTNEFGISKFTEITTKNHQELILLDPHEDATGIDHDFQSPTFRDLIENHIQNYLICNGRYKNKDEF